MKCGISSFDRTVIKKDITRFAPVWAMYLIAGLLVSLNGMGSTGAYYISTELWQAELANEWMDNLRVMAVVNLFYAGVCAQMVFGDLFHGKLCNALHALPLRREDWFRGHALAALAFSLIPNLILSLFLLTMLGQLWYLALLWLLGVMLQYLFFFGVAVLSCMLAGNRVGMAATYALLNFLSLLIYWFADTFYVPLLRGVTISAEDFVRFSPAAWLAAYGEDPAKFDWVEGTFQGLTGTWLYLLVLGALGIGALLLSVRLYRRRKLECAGDLLAFRPLKPVFAVIATLSCGAVFQLCATEMFNGDMGYLYLIVGIVVGYFSSRMLLERRVKVFYKGSFFRCGAIVGAMGLSLLLTWLDPLGVSRWVPETQHLDRVILAERYAEAGIEADADGLVVEDPAQLALVAQAQEYLNREGKNERFSNCAFLTLRYELDNGRVVQRCYYYPADGEASEILQQLLSQPEYVLDYRDWDVFCNDVESILVNGEGEAMGEQAQGLLQAIYDDCVAGNMIQGRNWMYFFLEIQRSDRTDWVKVYEDCEHILTWLRVNMPEVLWEEK